LDDILLIHCWG